MCLGTPPELTNYGGFGLPHDGKHTITNNDVFVHCQISKCLWLSMAYCNKKGSCSSSSSSGSGCSVVSIIVVEVTVVIVVALIVVVVMVVVVVR
jgi:hypothetical protein